MNVENRHHGDNKKPHKFSEAARTISVLWIADATGQLVAGITDRDLGLQLTGVASPLNQLPQQLAFYFVDGRRGSCVLEEKVNGRSLSERISRSPVLQIGEGGEP